MNKKEVFLRILRALDKRPRVGYLCLASKYYCNETEHQAFRAWIMGMLGAWPTVTDWLCLRDKEVFESLRWNYSAYRKAWIKHLINYLESLP